MTISSAWPGYQLDLGDSVRVSVWTGNEYLEQTLTVASDGTMLIPFFVNKLLPVTGMTAVQLRDRIQSELQNAFLSPVVQVLIVGFQNKSADLMGETTAGRFPISVNTPILDFVLQHGGFGPKANLADVQVTREDGEILKTNIYDIVIKGDKSKNIILNPNDIVYVRSLEISGNKYFMLGEVRSPGLIYSSEELSLLEAIAKSGTLTPQAQTKHVFVVRLDPKGTPQISDIRFQDLYRKGDPKGNIPLKNGDIVYVPKNMRAKLTDVLNMVNPIITFIWSASALTSLTRNP